MNDIVSNAEKLAEHAHEYLNTKIELLKLNAAEKSSAVLANIIAGAIVSIVVVFCLVFVSIAVALVLSNWIGHSWSGFFIVAGFYLLAGAFILTFKEQLIRLPIMNNIIRQLFKNEQGNGKEN